MGMEIAARSLLEERRPDMWLTTSLKGLPEMRCAEGDCPLSFRIREPRWRPESCEHVELHPGGTRSPVEFMGLLHFSPSQACRRAPPACPLSPLPSPRLRPLGLRR